MNVSTRTKTVGISCLLLACLLLWWPVGCRPLRIPPEPADQLSERVLPDDVFEGPRSPHWSAVRDHFVALHPNCAACGATQDLNVHHIIPFAVDPRLELDTSNLIVLCREHHFVIGHHRNWKFSNVHCVEEVEAFRKAHPWK